MRLLGYVRLSDLADDSTSPDRQREKIAGYAKLKDAQLVDVAEDLDISGKVSPFKRPGLGPWLNGQSGDIDAIVVWRLDRLTRKLGHFIALMSWCETHGKTIISVDESLDFSTPMGRMFAQLLVMFAEYEREATALRVRQHYAHQQSKGKYAGNQCPFGLRPTDDGGFEHDPVYALVVREMASRLLAGESLNAVARWLNDESVPTSRNIVRARGKKAARESRWTSTSVRKILAGRGILGEVTANGKPVHDETGHVVIRCEPIIDHATWTRVQEMLARNKSAPRVDASPLLGIATCGVCGAAMYVAKVKSGSKVYRYYRCRDGQCANRRVSADSMEAAMRDEFMAKVGHTLYLSADMTYGRDDAKIAQLAETIGSLSSKLAMARAMGQPTDALESQVSEIQVELDAAMRASTEPTVRVVETGQTMGTVFDQLDDNGRCMWLRSMGVTVSGKREGTELPEIIVNLGGFLRGRSFTSAS
jgi:site-specific DNA recombinase